MHGTLGKIGLGIGTYREAAAAIRRQFKPGSIVKVQNEKLRLLVRYSFEKIKYYREVFDRAGIGPEHIRTAEDLARIPLLTKAELRGRFWDFLPWHLPACRISRTSGSTGVPVCILSDRSSRMFNSAAVIRYRRALGIGLIGGPILTPLKTANEPWKKQPHWTYLQGIHKTYYVNPYVDSDRNNAYARELLGAIKRPALIGITPAIRALAYRVRDGLWPSFEPSVVLTTGESLSPKVRRLCESVFGSVVADIYSCNEAGDVAWQCVRGGYHINSDNVIVEIVKDDEPVGPGELGEVVITNLNRYAMPIIRYKNGDLARLSQEQCACGCRLPMMAEIGGRTGQDIVLLDGTTVPWNQLKGQMNHPAVRQFQLVQNADGSLTIRYIPEAGADTIRIEKLLLNRYRRILGPTAEIQTEVVQEIPPAANGKSDLVVSHYKRR